MGYDQVFSNSCFKYFVQILATDVLKIFDKTGVINDLLGLPTVPAGSDCRSILKFWDERTDGRTLCMKIVIATGQDCGQPRGSIILVEKFSY